MKIHPEILEAVKISARFGFINRSIFNEFVTSNGPCMAYKVWKRMKDQGLFQSLACKLVSQDYVSLTRKGKILAQSMNLEPVATPYVSVINHDELLMRIVLANERSLAFNDVQTEAALKANPKFFGRNFSVSNQKYPDLYVNINGSRIAIEYERTRKSSSSYRQMLTSYSIFREVDLVLFVVASDAIKNAITDMASRIQYPSVRRPLAFAMAEDVSINLLSFPISMKNEVMSFKEICYKAPNNIGTVA